MIINYINFMNKNGLLFDGERAAARFSANSWWSAALHRQLRPHSSATVQSGAGYFCRVSCKIEMDFYNARIMRTRLVTRLLRARLRQFPAVALLGPRQCGKTTLARALKGRYYDAEQPAERLRLDLDWEALVAGGELAVIDEAQSWPALFPRLRGAIDAKRRGNGRFLLLGSVSPALTHEVAESLAGRIARIEMTPFLLPELGAKSLARLWLDGGYPDGGVLRAGGFPIWQRDYLASMAQRDLPAWGLPARPQVTDRLLHMLAALHGQLWNASTVANSMGLSYHTINGYLDHLEGAYLVRRLAPWSGKLLKRLTKSPKVYVRDTGLLHALLGVNSRAELLRSEIVSMAARS